LEPPKTPKAPKLLVIKNLKSKIFGTTENTEGTETASN